MIEIVVVVAMVVAGGMWRRPVPAPRGIPPAPVTSVHRRVRRLSWWAWARRDRVDPSELAGWCDALARAVRGGETLHHAVRSVAPPDSVAGQLEPALLALSRGASLGDALGAVSPGSPHLELVVVVLQASARHGAAPAEPIDRAAAALRQRAALSLERRTQSAQARSSAVVMTTLPGLLLGLLLITSAPTRAAAMSTPGLVSIAAGIVCNAAGWMWMRHVIGAR